MLKKLIQHYTVHKPDFIFLSAVAGLVVFGLLILTSASAPLAFERFGDSYYYIKHQLIFGLLPGIFLFIVFSLIDYTVWRKYSFLMLVISIILLVMVFIPGIGAEFGTAHSWIGFGDFSLQPSEIVKLTYLIYLASWLESRGHMRVGDLHEGLKPFLITLGAIMLLMILQPDIGTMSIIVMMSMAVYFVGGAQLSHVVGLGAAGIAGILFLIKIAPYRAARFTVFLHPEFDPQGIGYHINQAYLAIGSGGLFGKGFGLSRQKFQYLPEVMGDSIYAILSEELGFIFSVATVLLFFFLLKRGLLLASNCKDKFGKFLIVGVMSWVVIQAFFNIGAMVGLMPLTGVPLPFISYGGTSLMVTLAAMGLVANISRHVSVK